MSVTPLDGSIAAGTNLAVEAEASAHASMPFTDEQRAAIAARAGSGLLSANAGSGKTAVMVERFVESVLFDGIAVGELLALTFTEKAAGELRARLHKRFSELGERELARETEAAWVGTIHGFCARVLREEPLALGLDPRFAVLDEPAARRLAERAFQAAVEAWIAAHGAAAVDLAAAYGITLAPMLIELHAELRSRGQTSPRLPAPLAHAVPDPAGLRRALAPVRVALADAGDKVRVKQARTALEACAAALSGRAASDPVPRPDQLAGARLPTGGAALATADCDAYREAWDDYTKACADHHGAAAIVCLGDLLERFGQAYDAAKADRAAVDFGDLELLVRDLLTSDASVRSRWSERFARVMIDEFQDTNRVQLDLLEHLERDNLFAVGDEFQSIYGFRHADVTIFRERRAALDAAAVRRLTANFRSHPALLAVVNHAFAPIFGADFAPLRAGRPPAPEASSRVVETTAKPRVDLLVTASKGWESREADVGLRAFPDPICRRAEARLVARAIRAELGAGRPPGDVVVLLRATASLRLFEQALEEEGVPTYVLGGRGYWSQEQVRDALAYLGAVANPLDEPALFGALASPFAGAGTDALVLIAQAGRDAGTSAWAALRDLARRPSALDELPDAEAARVRRFAALLATHRELAEGIPVERLLEQAVAELGYDLAILARAGGDRRMANLRKLMRMAREYESAEGHDLRGFITFATGEDLREAREGEAPLEAEDLDAVRLMTIHRAKGLEFPVVVVADLGRQGSSSRGPLLVGRDDRVGLRLAMLGGGERTDALDYRALSGERAAADDAEERRLLYVALTRAERKLILSGGIDLDRLPAPRPGGAPLAWLLPALLGAPAGWLADPNARSPDGRLVESGDGPAAARLTLRVATPGDFEAHTGGPGESRAAATGETDETTGIHDAGGTDATRGADGTGEWDPTDEADEWGHADGADERVEAVAGRARAATTVTGAARLSYTALSDHARCGYRYYLQRVLGLPDEPPPAPGAGEQLAWSFEPGVPARVRGVVVHALLEAFDFARPAPPACATVIAAFARAGVSDPSSVDVEVVRRLVGNFARSPLCARLERAVRAWREAPFACIPAAGEEPLITGFFDVHATEGDGRVLIVDYKSERLEGEDPDLVAARDHDLQRCVYALAALTAGATAVDVAFSFLERPEDPVTVSFGPGDRTRLAARLRSASRGVLEQDWPVATRPHRLLCGDCPGRPRLCSHPETLTLRERP